MKLYEIGLVVGRFQMLHKGHVKMIKYALELCDKVVVFIGSSQESRTETNPFSYYVRENFFKKVFHSEIACKKLLIYPLEDIGVGNNDRWGSYILESFEKIFYRQPDLYITGCEKERPSWFSNAIAPDMDELRLSRNVLQISASECRKMLKEDRHDEWCKMVPYELYGSYESYKSIIEGI